MSGPVYLNTSVVLSALLEAEKYRVVEDVLALFQNRPFVARVWL